MSHSALNKLTWKRTADASVEAVLTADVKAFLRVTHDDSDSFIDTHTKAARQLIEDWTGRAFITQTWKLLLDRWPTGRIIRLPRPPLNPAPALTVKYYGSITETLDTLAASTYFVDSDSDIGRIKLKDAEDWPDLQEDRPNAVEIAFNAGFGDAGSDVPEPLRMAIKLLTKYWYDSPDTVIIGTIVSEAPMGVQVIVHDFEIRVPEHYF
jgi:uncharacterized phiE125 gp8 family phage protein